jgi:hypothetical protein
MSPFSRRSLLLSAGSVGAALVFGVGLHFLAVYLRDHGPSGSGFSLQGNGATIVFLPALIAIVGGEIYLARHRAWLGIPFLPLTLFLGLFSFGGF